MSFCLVLVETQVVLVDRQRIHFADFHLFCNCFAAYLPKAAALILLAPLSQVVVFQFSLTFRVFCPCFLVLLVSNMRQNSGKTSETQQNVR